jgi:hypothetical protein
MRLLCNKISQNVSHELRRPLLPFTAHGNPLRVCIFSSEILPSGASGYKLKCQWAFRRFLWALTFCLVYNESWLYLLNELCVLINPKFMYNEFYVYCAAVKNDCLGS